MVTNAQKQLSIAVANDDVNAIQAALAMGADVGAKLSDDEYAHTALSKAVGLGHYDSVQALVAAGANPNSKTLSTGAPMIMMAAVMSNVEMIEFLHSLGADPNVSDRYGHTALTQVGRSSATRTFEAAQALLAIGADPKAQALSKETALHGAVERRCIRTMHLVIDHGCPLDVADTEGDTPLDRAKRIVKMNGDRDPYMLTFLAAGIDPVRIPDAELRDFGRVQAAAAVGWTTQCLSLLQQGLPARHSTRHKDAAGWAESRGHEQTAAAIRAWSAMNQMRQIAQGARSAEPQMP